MWGFTVYIAVNWTAFGFELLAEDVVVGSEIFPTFIDILLKEQYT